MMMMGGNNQFTTQNKGDGSLRSNGMNNDDVGIGRKGEIVLEKGSWTVAEYAMLAEYVRSHGEGNWNVVQKNTGLTHCGKRCRLRWADRLLLRMVARVLVYTSKLLGYCVGTLCVAKDSNLPPT
ncbi:hypothetical protein GOBAR_AA01604 [Gossypium barbadense]|uniref:Uncharacterized protein n=1 Tax=Gossypium barbadense TaxID=3634 RepID=A0A2P5YTN0_GOSBA|nr:hypothetical protein GOBAR_AA01604 [Gossypium barbadense]